MNIDESDVKDKGWRLLVELFKTAKADNQITKEEEVILRTTDFNVLELLKYVKKAWDDGILTEHEMELIRNLITKIEDDATTLAADDNIITDDEENLLEIIRNILQEFFEENFDIKF